MSFAGARALLVGAALLFAVALWGISSGAAEVATTKSTSGWADGQQCGMNHFTAVQEVFETTCPAGLAKGFDPSRVGNCSKLRPSVSGGACPPQWLRGVMAVSMSPSPPSPPLQPFSRYAISSSDLIEALNDSAVSKIVLRPGTYEFADGMCSDTPRSDASGTLPTVEPSALCIDRNVTIEAEVAGSVVLDAKLAWRVIYVAATGMAELVRLHITGGYADWVGFLTSH